MDFGRVYPFIWIAAGVAVLAAFGIVIAYAVMNEITGSPF